MRRVWVPLFELHQSASGANKAETNKGPAAA
jgi:hypothetical protein